MVVVVFAFFTYEPFQYYFAKFVAKRIHDKTSFQVVFKSFRWKLFEGFHVYHINICDGEKPVAGAEEVFIDYAFSLKKPFFYLKNIHLERPIFVFEEKKLKELPGNDSSRKSYIPFQRIEIKKGRFVVLREGEITLSLRDISLEAKFLGENLRSYGSFVAENPAVGLVDFNLLATFSNDGITLRNFSSLSPGWGLLQGSGFWDIKGRRGFFSVSVEDVDFSRIPFTMPFSRNVGSLSLKLEFNVNSEEIDGRYSITDCPWGQGNGDFWVKRDSEGVLSFRQRGFHNVLYRYGEINFNLKGIFENRLKLKEKDVRLKTFLHLKDSEVELKEKKKVFIKDFVFSASFEDKKLEVERLHLVSSLGDLKSKGVLALKDGIKAFIIWNFQGNLKGSFSPNSIGNLDFYCQQIPCDLKKADFNGTVTFESYNFRLSLKGSIKNGFVDISSLAKIEKVSDWLYSIGKNPGVNGRISFESALKGFPSSLSFNAIFTLDSGSYGDFFLENLKVKGKGTLKIVDLDDWAVTNQVIDITFSDLKHKDKALARMGSILVDQERSDLRFSGNFRGGHGFNTVAFRGFVKNLKKDPFFALERAIISLFGSENIYVSLGGRYLSYKRAIDINNFKARLADEGITGKLLIGQSGNLEGTVKLEKLNLISRILKPRELKVSGGLISGDVVLRGSFKEPNLYGQLGLSEGKLLWSTREGAGFIWDRALVEFSLKKGRLVVNTLVNSKNAKAPLGFNIDLPVDFSLSPFTFEVKKDGSLGGKVFVDNLEVSNFAFWLLPVREAKGYLKLDLNISGSLEKPSASGEGYLSDGFIVLKPSGYVVSELKGSFVFRPEGIYLRDFSAKTFKGEASLEGFAPYGDFDERFNVKVRLRDVTVPGFYGIETSGSGEVDIVYSKGYPLIDGFFKVKEAELDIERLIGSIKRSIDVVEVYKGDYKESETIIKPTLSRKLSGMDFALNLVLDLSESKRARIRGKGIYEEVTGKLWLKKEVGKNLRLEGLIEHVKGWYEFQSVKINVSEGYIKFKGSTVPELYFVAQKVIQDKVISVYVTGPADDFQIKLLSSPPMSDTDMVSYLLFNRPASNLKGSESIALQERAAVFLGSKASEVLKKAIGETPFTPDVLQIKEGSYGDSVIEIGKYISPDFYITYEKNLRAGGSFNIEYRLTPNISIQSQIGNSRQSGVDIFWRYDFGK